MAKPKPHHMTVAECDHVMLLFRQGKSIEDVRRIVGPKPMQESLERLRTLAWSQ